MEHQTPRELLDQFYTDNDFGEDGGQSSSSVKIEITPRFAFYFPNFDARRKAVIKHDIHHLLTGYETSLSGESEISAWEIASGCKSYWAAFLINTSGTMLGIPINFMGTLKAFARGRKTKNLYHDVISTEQVMDMKISELRQHLQLDQHPIDTKPSFSDFILFSLFAFYGALFSFATLFLLPFIVVYSVYKAIERR